MRRRAWRALGGAGNPEDAPLGYDGKGQAKVTSADDAAPRFRSFKDAPAILEGFVDFAFEASVVAARGRDGSFRRLRSAGE